MELIISNTNVLTKEHNIFKIKSASMLEFRKKWWENINNFEFTIFFFIVPGNKTILNFSRQIDSYKLNLVIFQY